GAGNHAGGRSAGIAHTHPARLHEVRSGHRPDDRQSARPRRAADAACPRRRVDRMNRREFIALLGGAAAWPLAGHAQQQGDLFRRVGILISGAETDPEMQARVATIRQRLDSLGWSEGRNLRIDIRFAEADPGRHMSLARALVALRPDAIIAYSTPV